eukprot:5106809-Amphidinium_carterae.1
MTRTKGRKEGSSILTGQRSNGKRLQRHGSVFAQHSQTPVRPLLVMTRRTSDLKPRGVLQEANAAVLCCLEESYQMLRLSKGDLMMMTSGIVFWGMVQ